MSTCLFYILILFNLVSFPIHALYTEQSIILNVDVTIKTVSPLLEKANSNILSIIQTSFQNTNRDALYLYIIPISNLTLIGNGNSFRYNALLNVYCLSQTEYTYAITKYEDVFSNDMTTFIQRYEINIYNALLRALNVDSLGSSAVTVNTLNMIQGHFIVNYVAKRTPTPHASTIPPNVMVATSDPDAYIKDNIVLFLIIGGVIMFICFCCTIGCFWCSDRVQKGDNVQKKQNMLETEALRLQSPNCNNNNNNNYSCSCSVTVVEDIKQKDPFEWNTDEVTMWLKQQGLFASSASNINGRDLLISTVTEVEMKECDKFVEGIKKLRLESNSYSLWKFENAINELYNEENMSYSDESQSQVTEVSLSKKKRKPPKKLRKRAKCRKRRKRTEVSVSPSSTMEIGRKSVEIIQTCDTNYIGNRGKHLTVPVTGDAYATCESSRDTEGSATEKLYDSEEQQMCP